MSINWTKSGTTGMAANGWMISQSGTAFHVFDADDRFVGRFETREDAEKAVTA